jgi:hypothetical protein
VLPLLLLLHDALADQPVRLHHGRVHRRARLAAGLREDGFDIGVEVGQFTHACAF